MKTMMLVAAMAAVTALGAEPAADSMRQKLRAKITESVPASQVPKAPDETATTVESVVFTRPMPRAAFSIDHRKGGDEEVVMMKPMTVIERFNLHRLELAMELEGAKQQAEKNRHFSLRRGGGIIYEGRLGKTRFAFGVVGPLPFFGLSW